MRKKILFSTIAATSLFVSLAMFGRKPIPLEDLKSENENENEKNSTKKKKETKTLKKILKKINQS